MSATRYTRRRKTVDTPTHHYLSVERNASSYTNATAHTEDVAGKLELQGVYLDRCGQLWTARNVTVDGVEHVRVSMGSDHTLGIDVRIGVLRLLGALG